MPTLYECPPTRSQRAKWVLEELDLSHESKVVNLMQGEQNGDEYRKINPLSVVPAYVSDKYSITESVAIVQQLIDEHPGSKLAPEVGTPLRAAYYQWCTFGAAELDGPLAVVTQNEMLLPEDERDPDAAKRAREILDVRAEVLSNVLKNADYLVGDTFSGADIVIGYNCVWASFTGVFDTSPTLSTYLARLQERAGFQRAFAPA